MLSHGSPVHFCQAPHAGRIEHSHNILPQHSLGVHGNQSLADTGSPLPQRTSNTQNTRLQTEGSFGLGGPGAPAGDGADHTLDVSAKQQTCLVCSASHSLDLETMHNCFHFYFSLYNKASS